MASVMLKDSFGVYITSQNMDLFLCRTESSVLITSYKSSPTIDSIIGTVSKLLISYPNPAIYVSWFTINDSAFLGRFADFLAKMKRETLGATTEKTTKVGEILSEERESVHLRFATELLTGILRAVGKVGKVARFVKRIGDEVL